MQTRSSKTTIVAAVLVLIVTLGFLLIFSDSYSGPALANENAGPNTQELRAGKNYIPTKIYSAQDDEQILKFFEDLRVSDVSDGMDKVGLTNTGLMSPEIHALWKDTVHYKHRFIGIAVTVRYVPTLSLIHI